MPWKMVFFVCISPKSQGFSRICQIRQSLRLKIAEFRRLAIYRQLKFPSPKRSRKSRIWRYIARNGNTVSSWQFKSTSQAKSSINGSLYWNLKIISEHERKPAKKPKEIMIYQMNQNFGRRYSRLRDGEYLYYVLSSKIPERKSSHNTIF